MAKKNFSKGIDRVFSSTTENEDFNEFEENKEDEPVGTNGTSGTKRAAYLKDIFGSANYNLKYPKVLQKQIKMFCLDKDMDMKDVFIEGAKLYMKQSEL